jgi:DNA-binding response OmpR family regulator
VRVLVVEDEPVLRRAYLRALEKLDMDVEGVATATTARRRLEWPVYDVISIDRKLPDGDGLALCRELRARGDTTLVLMLTSLCSDEDILTGLACGADDYVLKPVTARVMAARVAALVRRARQRFRVTGLRFDRSERTVRYLMQGQLHTETLSDQESRLLAVLMDRPGEIAPRAQLHSACWGDAPEQRWNRLDVLALRLRQKLGPHAGRIETVRGEGIRLSN